MLKNRFELAEHFKELGFEKGAEIGVFAGYYSEILCKTIPNLELIAVDPWEIYQGYRDRKFVSSMEIAEAKAREVLAPYNVKILKKFSDQAADDVADGSLDFVYIDGNHRYEFVKDDIRAWTPKVREGGIVSGDDFYITGQGNNGVIDAVLEYVEDRGYKLNVTALDKSLPKEDDQQPQWWFQK